MSKQEVFIITVGSQWEGETSLDVNVYATQEEAQAAYQAAIQDEHTDGMFSDVKPDDIYRVKEMEPAPDSYRWVIQELAAHDDVLAEWQGYRNHCFSEYHRVITLHKKEIKTKG